MDTAEEEAEEAEAEEAEEAEHHHEVPRCMLVEVV